MWFLKKQKSEKDWTAKGENMWLIVGLGNPGKEYTSTFHNCGFMTLEVLAQKHNIRVDKLKWKGEYGRGTIEGEDCILLRPHTFMNLSGQSVIEVMRFFKIPLDHLIVIYCVESQDFARVRIGCGPVPEHWDLADFVLSSIPKEEQETMLKAFEEGAKAVEDILSGNSFLKLAFSTPGPLYDGITLPRSNDD